MMFVDNLFPISCRLCRLYSKWQAVVNVKRIPSVKINKKLVESGHVGSIIELGEHHVNISTYVKLRLLNTWRSLSTTMEQTRETLLA